MIDFIYSIFVFSRRLFLWMPPFLYEFIVAALNISAFAFIVAVSCKLISLGFNFLKTLF